ncbi:glycoside hydrolase family 15 protein [Candidatus Daviesbacteria bacterium]|nr:glycoside hydrolase family 15 protein [Candidatus Daviesbacteria bacterium]
MPKSLVLGNGNTLIGLDKYAQVADFYFPYVGLENQVGGHHVHKIGVWVDNKLSWFDDGNWEIGINYVFESLVSRIEAVNHNLGVKITFRDAVYNETDIFIRELNIYNLSEEKRIIKVFFHQKFEINQSRRADTAYYDPEKNVIIHYKGRRVFLINAASGTENFDDFGIGNFNIEGKEGTYKDAEDGILSKNPIEHGLVDSVIGFTCHLEGLSTQELYYWITAARQVKEAHQLNGYLLKKSPKHLIQTTEDFWRAWVNKQRFDFCDFDKQAVDLFKKSLFIMRTQVDNRGAILASSDSDMLKHGKDNYSYVWPRDGAIVAQALDQVMDNNITQTFYQFANKILTDGGYFMHKYLADQSLGSSWHPWIRANKIELPIQEDETALVVVALKDYYDIAKDLEFIESIYNSLIKKAADFMVSYRDDKTKLPKPSYDLWEEKFGVHTYTASSVFAALNAASQFANLLGKGDAALMYMQTAQEIREAIIKYLYSEEEGYFYKSINFEGDQLKTDKILDLSSCYGVFKFKVLDADDERLVKSFKLTEEKLFVQGGVGGFARYLGDDYYRVSQDTPGNPWFITTLWYVQFQIANSKTKEDLEKTKHWFGWVVKYALPSGILSEQLHPFTGEQVSAAPLTWSHAEFVLTVLQYLKKMSYLGFCG